MLSTGEKVNVSVQGSRVPQTARRYCAAEVEYQVGYDEPRKYGIVQTIT